LLSFLAGKHDDQVDALGPIEQLLDKMTACRPPKKSSATTTASYKSSSVTTL
jgi:hypothetical protein